MAATPGMALAGTASLGMGSLLLYAAYRNVPVFGPDGLLTGALRTGKLQPVTAAEAQAEANAQEHYVPWYDRTGPQVVPKTTTPHPEGK